SLCVKCVIVCYRSGEELHGLLCVPRLNGLDGANRSDCAFAVGTLVPFHSLLNDLSLLVLGVTSLSIPAYRHPEQQRDDTGDQCFHAMSVAQRPAEAPASTDGAKLKLQGQSLVLTPVASSGGFG